MNRQTIEKAAIEFAQSHYLDKYGNLPEDIPHKVFEDLVVSIAYMFIYGANWRINSVWHDASEKPEFGGEARWIVMYFEHGMLSTTFARKDEWHELRKSNSFTKWAYQTDLMPDRKEETK